MPKNPAERRRVAIEVRDVAVAEHGVPWEFMEAGRRYNQLIGVQG